MLSNCTITLLAISAIVIAIFFVIYFNQSKSPPLKEGFGDIVGALAPYKDIYTHCLSECEKSDPRMYLGADNWGCQTMCRSRVTDMRRGNIAPPVVVGTVESCTANCDGNRRCVEDCSCYGEIIKWCAMECQYSADKGCQDQCFLAMQPNCNGSSWTFKG